MYYKIIILIAIAFVCVYLPHIDADKACKAREIAGQSVVCVCSYMYCDEIVREPVLEGKFVAYSSSKDGLRFQKTFGTQSKPGLDAFIDTSVVLQLMPNITYQHINGFGGAVTDAAGINWNKLPCILKKYLINSYFGDRGIEYNMIRTPIGASDFSTRVYTYHDQPENDTSLANFTLANEDRQYKIPMIKECIKASNTPIKIIATTWSPPAWMKKFNEIAGYSRLKKEYYQTYADYHKKYLEAYAKENITMWALTTTNEPINGVAPLVNLNSLGWSATGMGKWIVNNLGPTIKNSTFKDVKILTLDDQRYVIPIWLNVMVKENPDVLKWIDGVAVHYYGNIITKPEAMSLFSKSHPDKFLLSTEACEGSLPWVKDKVLLGSWERASNYINDILENLNYDVTGWIDWNMCLNAQGGPNWANNFVDSPIIVYPEKREFIKQPMFYALGHFSKFLPAGSKRIKVSQKKAAFIEGINNVAFITPRKTIATVIYNNQ